MKTALPVILGTGFQTLAISVPTVFDSWKGSVTRESCDERLDRWSRRVLDLVKVTVDVQGRENLDVSGATIVMSNHQSLYDIPLLFQVLPKSLRMIAKHELFKVPVWGPAMRASGFIAIDRDNRHKAFQSLQEAKATLESGVTVWMAPEGTRSRDGQLLPFKKGGFVLAEQMGASILPVSIRGTRDILPAKTMQFNPGVHVTVTIHPRIPVPAPESGPGRVAVREQLMQRVRDAIQSGL